MQVEKLRKFLLTHKKYRSVADETGIPYDSLTKFAYGAVKEPRYSHLKKLWDWAVARRWGR